MDRVWKTRDDDRDRHSGKDHRRDRDHKNRRHHHDDDDDERDRSRNEKRRRSRKDDSPEDSPQNFDQRRDRSPDRFRVEGPKDEKQSDSERRHRSRVDSPKHREAKRDQSVDRLRESVERLKDEKHHGRDRSHRSRADSPKHREQSVDRLRESAERPKDEKHHDRERRHRSRADSIEDGLMREPSLERYRGSVERNGSPPSSRKRKEHDGSEEDLDKRGKRARGSDGRREERRERRRFGDRAVEDRSETNGDSREERVEGKAYADKKEGKDVDMEEDREEGRVRKEDFDEEERKVRRERRKFSDRVKIEEKTDSAEALEKSGSNVVSEEPLNLPPMVSVNSAASCDPFSTKVSSITTTNENEGVNITRSDEITGKSSTDGTTTSVAGKSSSLTLDALAKAKKALQMQRELKEKLKKIPMLHKPDGTSTDNNSKVASNRDGLKVATPGIFSTASASTISVQALSGTPKVPVGVSTSEKQSVATSTGVIPGIAAVPNYEAVKRAQELAAKMGFRQDPDFAPLINMFPGPSATDVTVPQKPTKAPVLRLDAQGREIDEHGNIINMPKLTNLSTLKVNINKQKKEAFQILRPELDADPESNPHFDERLGIDKTKLLRPKRMTFQFVEEGTWSKQAEHIKFKSQFGEAQAKELKTKQSQLAKAKTEVDNPNLIELPERVDRGPRDKKKDDIPEIEWWDKPLLPSGSYIDVDNERLNMDKLTIYVEHPRPIEPPAEPAPPPPQPLKLTKKEQKKLRTQRRLAKERDRQEMIRQGLLEPPKSKVKLTNLMKVLGSEATQDPTRLEMEIRTAAEEREQAHIDRNVARKLTPAERREKKERKLFEDPNALETHVSVYKIKDLSHPQTRFKVDVNAQENRLTGVAVISDGTTVVVVEGGKKSIKRYGKLMLKRINWAAAVGNEEDGADDADTSVNSCLLVWQGSVAKPNFNRFLVHQCRTEAAAKKVFADAGVPHYWDLAVNFSEEL